MIMCNVYCQTKLLISLVLYVITSGIKIVVRLFEYAIVLILTQWYFNCWIGSQRDMLIHLKLVMSVGLMRHETRSCHMLLLII